MTIIDNRVLVGAGEIIQFFQNNHEGDDIVLCQGERVIGDITAITSDDRFVLDLDMYHDAGIGEGGVELYSAKFKEVTMTRIDNGTIELRII